MLFAVNHTHELGIDGTKVYFRVLLKKLPLCSKPGCLLIVLKLKVANGGTEPALMSRFILPLSYIVSKSGVAVSVSALDFKATQSFYICLCGTRPQSIM